MLLLNLSGKNHELKYMKLLMVTVPSCPLMPDVCCKLWRHQPEWLESMPGTALLSRPEACDFCYVHTRK